MAEEQILNTGIQFEDIVPWVNEQGDTGLTSRLKLKRNFDKIKAWMDAQGNAATQQWVDDNYLTKDFFSAIFQLQDSQGNAILPNTATEAKDRLKILVGAYTEQYLSALGLNDDQPACSSTLAGLLDVELSTPTNGQALVYDAATHKWTNGTIQAGTDMATVWTALADTTTEQISATHLTTALSGYATQSWVDDNYVSISFFERLFNAYHGNTKVSPNSSATIDNIKAMFGFWTEQYISALGKGEDESHEIGVLNDLNDVTLTNPTANQVLSYNGTHWVNKSIELGSQTLADLTDVVITSPAANQMLGYDAATQTWTNIAIPATGVTSVATGTGLTGGTITSSGTISINSTYQTCISHGETAYGWGNHANAGYALASSLGNYLPLAGGVLTNSNVRNLLTLNCTGAGNASFVLFNLSGINKADVGYSQNFAYISNNVASGARIGVSDTGVPQYWTASDIPTNTVYNLIHSGGGNFTGDITFTNSSLLFDLLRYSSSSCVDIGWSFSNKYGAGISFRSVNYNTTAERGAFVLYAQNSSQIYNLKGQCDGKLYWEGDTLQIGSIQLVYDSTKNAIKVIKSDGTAANFYATGGVSALGADQEGGGGSYLPLSGGTLTNTASDILTVNCTGTGNASFILFNLSGINKADVGYSQNFSYISNNVASGARIGVNDSGTPQYWDGVGASKNIYNLIHSGGGNFTGDITFTKDGLLFDILRYDSNYGVDFGWRFSNSFGAGIALRSVNCTEVNQRGAFIVYAKNSSTVKNLTGKCDGTLIWDGAMYAASYNNTSDIRKKNVIKDIDLRLDQIAKAPAFEYYWFDTSIDHDLHVGTSAQYWESVLPQVVTTAKDEIGTLSMQYGVAALISAITVARKVVKHEEKIALLETRVSALEKENGEQEQLINSLQEELSKFKAA